MKIFNLIEIRLLTYFERRIQHFQFGDKVKVVKEVPFFAPKKGDILTFCCVHSIDKQVIHCKEHYVLLEQIRKIK